MAAATAAPRAAPTTASADPWMTRVGQRTCAQSRSAVSRSLGHSVSMARRIVCGSVCRPQPTASSICLVECGSLNTWAKKNSRNPGQSRCQYRRFHLAQPTGDAPGSSSKSVSALLLGGLGGQLQVRADQHQAGDPLRVLGGQHQVVSVTAPGHEHRPFGSDLVEYGQGVADGVPRVAGRRVERPVRAPVAAPVERHHPAVAGQVGDLALPRPRVDDLPGRVQHDRGLPGPVGLVPDAYPVAVKVALDVGIPRPGLLVRAGTGEVSLPGG